MKIAEWVSRLGEVWVEGQLAQISRRPGTATAFLVLRDPSADMSIPVTCRRELVETAQLTEGSRVVLRARPDFYPARGSLSLRASEIRQLGVGELLVRLERLKRMLSAEGLFEPARKQRLPFLPTVVGLVTGRASAAERDVVDNARRRWPAVRFRVENVAVQGALAVPQVVEALRRLDADREVDVIVIARGGGSVEDLLPFSDETLCRAVAACLTPVVSAIGHEPDSPLLDLVADLRCSTPTDAGKRIVPDVAEQRVAIDQLRRRAVGAVSSLVATEAHRLAAMRSRPALASPHTLVSSRRSEVEALRDRATRHLRHALSAAADDVAHRRARVAALSPAATLGRGYAIVQRGDGVVVRRSTQVATDDRLRIRLAEGELAATVAGSHPEGQEDR
ncbi:MAG: exodeoxyribonuclease VII large subunit [Actinobacteria bacterium]|nr:exodeoxyribonuclease VII large subunit [Actinomycetota bacterium]MBI3688020.1 exodeoxyribonuclease VII large subunit [Actinomycetota bacterium]